MKKLSSFAVIIAVALTATAIGLAASTTVVVTEDDITRQAENTPPTDNWVFYTRNAATGTLRVGPGAPPLGIGSFETVTPTGADKGTLFNYDHVGTRLADIDALGYATYRDTGASPNQVPAINIQIDINGGTLNPGEFTTLVFEPVYNTGQGNIVDDQWQTWDAYMGGQAIWWSSNPIPGLPNRDTFVTWDTVSPTTRTRPSSAASASIRAAATPRSSRPRTR